MYLDPEDLGFFLNRVIAVISILRRETTFNISDLTCEPVSMESEIVRVDSLSTMEISEIKMKSPIIRVRMP